MIEVELPDGTIAEFPDGTSNDVIKGALQKRFATPAPEPTWGETALDAGASLVSGIGRGAAGLVGLPGTLGDLAQSGLSSALGLPQLPSSPFSSSGVQSGLSTVTGGASEYEPKTRTGEYAGTVGEFLPGAALGGVGIGNLSRFGALPGVASEAAGQFTEGSAIEPYARVAAALLAPAAPALASRAISPFSGAISPERMAAIRTLEAEGVPLTAGQRTGSNAIKYMESELGGAGAANIMDDQARAFTEAATSRAGMQGLATADNVAANADRLGAGFDAISARNAVTADRQLAQDMAGVLTEYNRVLPSAQREIVNNMADDIVGVVRNNGGSIPGDVYQSTRSRLSRMAQSARQNDPEYAQALSGLRNSLDEAMTRSVNPNDAAEWATLRQQWGNQRRIENAAAGAGENAALGMISPARLAQVAKTGRRGQYARGTGELDELARAGNAVMAPLPNSGTPGRLRAQNLGSGLLAGGGALAGGIPGLIAGLLAPRAAGAALMSRPVQAYLTNQLAPNMTAIDPRTLAVIESLLANEQGAQ